MGKYWTAELRDQEWFIFQVDEETGEEEYIYPSSGIDKVNAALQISKKYRTNVLMPEEYLEYKKVGLIPSISLENKNPFNRKVV